MAKKVTKSGSRDKLLKKKPSKNKIQQKQKTKRKHSLRLPPKIMTSDSSSINLVTQTHGTLETECDFPVIRVPSSNDLKVSARTKIDGKSTIQPSTISQLEAD